MTCTLDVQIFPAPNELFAAAAEEFISRASDAVSRHGLFNVALSGGSTPRGLYVLLAGRLADKVPWDKIRFFWGDERHVGPEDPESNYRMAHEAMLSKVKLNPANVFRVPAENPDAGQAAAEYEETLRRAFHSETGEAPGFDLILLGMGPDGHTASLFPGTEAVQEESRLVVANWVENFKSHRITLTVPVLNSATCVMFLVTGKDKAPALAAVFDESAPEDQYPAKKVRPRNGDLIWMVGRDAASDLPPAWLK
ncbi:MAG TPA: 6-phosphogluconolactonase [Terriglobales bacterium]|jgi:6-phosphogluconolactonase